MPIRLKLRWLPAGMSHYTASKGYGTQIEALFKKIMETKGGERFRDIINGDTPVLVDFFAEWCGPCKMMTPVLQQLRQKMQDEVRILKLDVDKNPSMASAFQVQGVPTLILFKQGKVLWRQSGVVPANVLENIIRQHSR